MGSLRALAFAMDLAITAAPLVAGLVAASLTAAPALAAGLDDVPFWIGAGQQSQSHLGYSVAPAGDVNGDGYSDVLAGARSFDNGQVNEGRAVVWLGGPGGPAASPDWSVESNQALAFAGASVASGGDVNGDGYDDVLVGTSSYDGALQNEGRAQLFLGSAAGLDTAAVWTVDGGQAGAAYGICVAFAGDVNGDGYDDVLVGARGWDAAQANAGRVFLYFGAPGGPATTAAWTADGTEEDAGFGYSVAGAGDVDADGYADVVVGAFWQNGAFVDQGAAFVWRGAPTLPAASPDWTLTGTQQLESFGWSVAPAGDVDGDGYADVIVGSRHYDGVAGIDAGRARLFRGGAAGLATTAAWTAESPRAGALFGWSVAPAGDVDGDGYADVVIGAYKDDVQYLDDGSAFLYLGGPAGLGASPAWVGTRGETNSAYGWSVAGAGDVDGDGYADVLVGAYLDEEGPADEGVVYLYRGRGRSLTTTPRWTATPGPSALAFGESVAFAGDVNG
ncbi:MAG: FG-GAP repeat protein, partial [Gemmatimonadetes bacterium]|nr:FG-GAP repeat protein [Gemmatimonadota bacterium]